MTPARVNGLVLLLCAMALSSMVEPVPGSYAPWFWLARAAGVSVAIAAMFWTRLQRLALVGTVIFLVAVPCVMQMSIRRDLGPHTWCHDSVVQFEEAARMVREGRNPYSETFAGTPMERWRDWKDNPALHHFVYPPFLLEFSIPIEAAGRALGFFDQRIVILLFYAGIFALLHRPLRDHPYGVAIAALVTLNPWFGPFVVEGRNDAAMLFWVVAAWHAFTSNRHWLGLLFMGLGMATKTLLWPAAPFLLLAHRPRWLAAVAVLTVPLAVTCFPFLALDAPAFLNDLLGAPAGMGDHPFEIRGWGGFGFANVVLALGMAGPRDPFPFWIFQIAALAPCLWFGGRSALKNPSWGNVLLWSTVTIFALLFFERFIHDNYIGVLLALLVIAWTARENTDENKTDPA